MFDWSDYVCDYFFFISEGVIIYYGLIDWVFYYFKRDRIGKL